jgi:hypothetical protein
VCRLSRFAQISIALVEFRSIPLSLSVTQFKSIDTTELRSEPRSAASSLSPSSTPALSLITAVMASGISIIVLVHGRVECVLARPRHAPTPISRRQTSAIPATITWDKPDVATGSHQQWLAWRDDRNAIHFVTSNSVVPCIVKTSRSLWFQSSDFDNRIPVRPDGDLLERSTSKRRATVSPGRTG